MDFRRALIAAHREVRVGHRVPRHPARRADRGAARTHPPASGTARTLPPQPNIRAWSGGDDAPLCAGDLSRALNDRILAHGPMNIVSDMGDCLFAAMELLPTPLVAPGYYATMGFGVPAGIGAQVATGERSLILVGDGAFQMTGWELGNCPRLGLDPIVILLNNQSWEMIRAFQNESQCAALGDWRFADMANVLGGRGHRVTTAKEFKAALDAAFAERGRFQLIEFMVPPGDSTPTLQRFSEGIRALRARAAAA